MKTIAARFEDELFEQIALVANLEGVAVVAVIRDAVAAHIERKMADGELAARAQSLLDDIDREAESRKQALGSLIGQLPKTTTPAKGRGRQRQSTEPEARLPMSRPIGYLASRDHREGGGQ